MLLHKKALFFCQGATMKRNLNALNEVKQRIASLKGVTLQMSINRGRKRFEDLVATIDNVYPSVFTIKQLGTEKENLQTFSYFDVISGDVIIQK